MAVIVESLHPPPSLAELHRRSTAWLNALCDLGGDIREEPLDGVAGGAARASQGLPVTRQLAAAFEHEVWRLVGGTHGVG